MSLTREQIIDGNIEAALEFEDQKTALKSALRSMQAQMDITSEEFWPRVFAIQGARAEKALADKSQCPKCEGTGQASSGGLFLGGTTCHTCEGTGSSDAKVINEARRKHEEEVAERRRRIEQRERIIKAHQALRRKKPPIWARKNTSGSYASLTDALFNALGL
jgi:hypothetical protein